MKMLKLLLSFVCISACTVDNDEEGTLKKDAPSIEGPIALSEAKLWSEGAKYSSFGVCVPLYGDLKGSRLSRRYKLALV